MGSVVDALGIARLWLHEALRVFADRLTDDEDREWFVSLARDTIVKNFKLDFDDALLGHLKDGSTSSSNPKIGYGELRNLFFGNYMLPSEAEVRPYTEITDVNELEENIKQYLVDFNAMSKKPMDLVMFRFAIEHVSRISRILLMPGGNALLVGVGGSGRQSLTILATEIAGFTLKRIEISKSYGLVEWRDDVKVILREAGTGEKPVVFLFADTQIKLPGFAEDINNILNSGDVPNLYLNDEKVSICEAVRPFAQAKFGKAEASRMTTSQLFDYFTQRVRQRLHVVLAFSPIGDAFRERLRLFPSLVACCVINWFTAWPRDALVAVANQKLAQIKDLENRAAIVESCQYFHVSATELSARFKEATGRITYVTPTSYLELLLAFESSLAERRESVLSRKSRYKNGLEQLALAEANVGQMHKELTDLQPVLKQSQEDTDALMSEIEAKLPGVRAEEELVAAEAMTAQKEADAVKKQVDDVQADLDEAIPALNEALKALDTIKPNDINEIKVLGKPPATVKLVCEAVCVMLGEKPVKVPDPDDPSRKIHDYWPTAQKMLADKNFISKMKMYDKDNIPVKTISAIRDKYINDPSFTPEAALKASSAAAGLCKWCHAMSTYDRVAKLVAPKKEALAKAQESLAVTMGNLSAKKGSLQETQDSLAGLQAKLSSSKSKKDDLNAQVETCAAKLVRAKKLIEDLGGEKIRWAQFVEDLASDYSSLTGDVLVSAALMAYLGPFISSFRDVQMESWAAKIKALNIPSSPNPTDIAKTLGDPVKIRQAIVDGLPTDKTSTENAIVVWKAKRFPYMIDPDGQAKRWIKKSENDRGLKINKPNGDYLRDLESCVQYGVPFLLEDVGETLDAALEPLLLKQIFKVGGIDSIRLGDSTLPFDQSFSFYMTTRLRNPHLLPEIAVKVSLLAFLVTPEGLSDRLLGVVVAQERQDLEQRKSELVVEGAANAAKLKSIEDSILQILSSEGNILEDETAILTLGKSKVTSDTIKQRQEAADLTESEIDAARSQYKPCASATQVLFFCISDLVSVEPTYSYSLQWFTNLFVRSIQNSESSDDVTTRLENLSRHFEYSLYQNVCRSLLEKDKLLFSFLLTVRTLSAAADPSFDAGEWRFLLTGGVGSDNPHPNPCPDWLAVKSWDELCRLSELPNFKGLSATFQEHQEGYKRLNDSAIPHELPLPGEWDAKLKGLRRLCVLRCVRPDKVSLGVQNFVIEAKGKKFVQPPPFDLQACFDESVSTTPLIFVLSPGSDPMAAVLQLAENEKHEVRAISLGQGQGPVAEKLITQSRRDGSWVVLQNCHLAPSWMSNLEQICESLSSENVAKEFRLWCTTYPSPVFPVSVLQSGIKMTLEPPKGLRANLIGSYSASPIADDGFLDSCSKSSFKKLVYSLCLFHALVQERREYGPIGWNIPYGFNASDLEISMQQLAMFLEESDSAHVPFEALKYCIGECNYGGRVTDAKDRITLNSILDRFFQADVVEVPGFSLSPSGKYAIPSAAASSLQHYVEIVEALPLVAEPEIFGFHENATITKDSNETDALFATLLLAEGSGGSSQAGQASADETVLTTACEILHKLPSEFDLEEAQIRYPVRWDESMNTVLCQELFKFNNLTKLIKSSLSSVIKAIKGTVVMSAELERVGESLVLGRIPDLWKSKSYPSFKDCASYISDILLRLDFFTTWLDREPPFTYWISAFFFPHAFFTASKQNMVCPALFKSVHSLSFSAGKERRHTNRRHWI